MMSAYAAVGTMSQETVGFYHLHLQNLIIILIALKCIYTNHIFLNYTNCIKIDHLD